MSVFDCSENEQNLANVDYILTNIITILEYAKTPEAKSLKLEDENEYKNHMEEKFQIFCDEYYSVFQKVISGEDLSPLLQMLAMINKIKSNECSLVQAEEIVGQQLMNNFIKF